MEISDVRVKLIQDSGDRLKAVCSITLDDQFVVRDLKVVEGTNGLFVAMPSRKLSVHCPQCRSKNHLRARFCNECGGKLPPARPTGDAAGRMRMHRDIAHPINPTFREIVQSKVIEKYRAESELAKDPDYVPPDIDAEFESTAEKPSEEASAAYAPSEYDQLIAGLNKGSQEAPRETEPPRPAPRAPRTNDRRGGGHGERPPRAPRGREARPARHDSRRPEPSRPRPPQRGQDRKPLPQAQPARFENYVDDEVNGNVARPGEKPPAYLRRTKPPAWKREEEPKSMAEPRLDQFDEPTPRRVAEQPRRMENPSEDRAPVAPPPRPAPPQPAARQPAPAPQPAPPRQPAPPQSPAPPRPAAPSKPAGSEDLPFGAGL